SRSIWRFSRRPISSLGNGRAEKNCTSSIPSRSMRSPSVGSANSSFPAWMHFRSSSETLKENAMTEGAKSSFVYLTYIRTTPEELWAALTTPDFMKKYWFGMNIETDWRVGSHWKLIFPDGRIADAGEVVEIAKPKRLVFTWRNQFKPELHEEGYARCV